MESSEFVSQLASKAGIEPFFYDIHGTRHETALDTKMLVLSGLGFDISSPAAVADATQRLDRAPWTAKTIFCAAARNSQNVDIIVPADVSGTRRWRLDLESKDASEGEFRPQDLPLVGTQTIDGARLERRRLGIAAPVPEGYHRLWIEGDGSTERRLIAVPDTCHLPEPLTRGARLWGLSTHLYSLRPGQNWGIGDFGDLAHLVRAAGREGASFVSVNPFHALLTGRPEHASPYSPSSRLFLNPAYIEIGDAPASDIVADLRRTPFVDYTGVYAAKFAVFRGLWAAFERDCRDRPGSPSSQAFARFVQEGGAPLQDFATFCALDEVLRREPQECPSWHRWPARFRTPTDPAVTVFARDNAALVQFHQYLQFVAQHQLGQAQKAASDTGMAIGIIRDLALGIDSDGADAWAGQGIFADRLRCGAPRDAFHPTGQEWGVLPFNPIALREDYTPFVQLLRANMQHAGGLRIDHIIGMERQFLVPVGESAAKGCYVRFPREELLGLIALESRRNRCMIIGEDLGTVPEGLRERMQAAQMFGCSILPFERADGGRFREPGEYRKHSVASAGTHDLPTIRGYWQGSDIATRERVGLQGSEESARASAERSSDKEALLDGLKQTGVLPDAEPTVEGLRRAIHAFLALSAAQLFSAQIDDLFDEETQLNVPGTVDAYPNWRRKLSMALEDPAFTSALADLALVARQSGRT